MKKRYVALLLAAVMVLSSFTLAFAQGNGSSQGQGNKEGHKKQFQLGVEVLLEDQFDVIEGKNVGLITNPTGVDRSLTSIVDLLHDDDRVNLVSLYGPEHGVRGDAQAGDWVPFYTDEVTDLPVYSLYGETRQPTAEMLEGVDVLLFDIQDVGTRFYTYIYTMAYAMEAAEENDIEFVVLDRPNPLGGLDVEGPVLEDKYSSFVGLYPIPLRHGMTVGELALYFNEEFDIHADLTVVEMNRWNRSFTYDDLPLEWVAPSPNMPTTDTAFVYPGAALIEGTNVSEGRGTTKPFEFIGAPFMNSTELSRELNAEDIDGVTFRAASFTPSFSKHAGELSHGVQIHVTDAESLNSVEMGLHLVKKIHDLYPEDFEFREENESGISFFDQLIGNGEVRSQIEEGLSVEEIMADWDEEMADFEEKRQNYLLY
ncbi:DUF1343 domain-containing protein [Alkalicoccus saliphilus]|uniref:DUF1343 domain-containing protein n=1 Tax=Alkalicoccus saliphilus TaxID=200989 RepID=A0A2T4U5A1_9BACI|nr:DUF1343 domain-containing protein [Alkalicoccus saliphilus]PTL38564.1 DUF1343 domain-containing protein [Alkalicoccus saliphilus]